MGGTEPKDETTGRPFYRWVVTGLVIVALLGVGYLLLRPTQPPLSVEPTPVEPTATSALEQAEQSPDLQLSPEIPPSELNVILITLDTLRSDRLSCYGSEVVDTPNIDRFASEGVRFTNAASTVPFTLPAHSSILTGTYPPHHGGFRPWPRCSARPVGPPRDS
jgi:hypothetical protein